MDELNEVPLPDWPGPQESADQANAARGGITGDGGCQPDPAAPAGDSQLFLGMAAASAADLVPGSMRRRLCHRLGAHCLEVQGKHGVKYLKYWFNEEEGTVFCLFEAPNAEAGHAVHSEAHGGVADEIIEVKEGT